MIRREGASVTITGLRGDRSGEEPAACLAETPDGRARWGARQRTATRHGARRQLRHVRRKRVWVASVLLLTGIPRPLFALVGLPRRSREPLGQRVVAGGAGGRPAAVASTQFVPTFALLLGTRATGGSAVEVRANGDAAFPRLWQDLCAARRTSTIQMYCAGAGAIADSGTRILAERARASTSTSWRREG